MKIFDYIFYRVYRVYLKKNDPARFAGIAYMTTLYIFVFFVFLGFLLDLIKGIDKIYVNFIFFVYFSIIVLFNIKRYSSKYILEMNNKYRVDKIPNWLFFVILPLAMIFGILFYILIKKSIVDEYQLQGYLYNRWS